MSRLGLSVLLVLAVIYAVPFVVYGLASVVVGLKTPEGASPARFLTGVLVSKVGTALAFVLIFYVACDALSGQWLLYAFFWWLMFAFDEIGQAIGPKYSVQEAVAGVVSETIYLPLSAYATHWLIGVSQHDAVENFARKQAVFRGRRPTYRARPSRGVRAPRLEGQQAVENRPLAMAMRLTDFELPGTVGPQDPNVGHGDKRSGERRRAKAPCAHIAIIRAVPPDARDRPVAAGRALE